MKKQKKQSDPNLKVLEDAIINRYVRLVSALAFLGLGIWMLLAPGKPDHASVEKGTVYILKEIWSFEAGIVIVVVGVLAILSIVLKLRLLYGVNFLRVESGYYFYENKSRTMGLASIRDGNDLVLFDDAKNRCIRFPKYYKTKYNKFRKAKAEHNYDCLGPYWSGDNSGFTFFYKGKTHMDIEVEKRENDLIVMLANNGGKFLIKDFKLLKDNKIRKVDFY